MRFNDNHTHFAYGPMDDDALRARAPSIFAEEKHTSRSERYTYIPTSAVIDGMRSHGFLPVFAKQGNSRIEGKTAYTKHLIRFRHQGEEFAERRLGGVYPEVVLVNSHDGTSAYRIMAGLFRLICLNGMMVSDRELTSVHVPHKGDVTSRVIEGSYTVIGESQRAIDAAETWSQITLNTDEQMAMAESARVIRFGDAEGKVETAITADQLLRARRAADRGNDLWRTMNRLQEATIRGGLTAIATDANNRERRVTTREVRGIDADVRVNRALWLLTERMAELRGAGAAA